MNTYEKTGGWGVLLLTTHPMWMRILSERSESKDLASLPIGESVLLVLSDFSEGRSIATTEGSGLAGKDLSSLPGSGQLFH
jgi:hypothetical protein